MATGNHLPMRPRNWLALAALWTLGAVWVGLVGTFVWSAGLNDDADPPAWWGWTLLGVATCGFVLALAGITAIRERGEAALAVTALVLALALTSLGGPFLFWGFHSFGD
jgi:hypothetical protein